MNSLLLQFIISIGLIFLFQGATAQLRPTTDGNTQQSSLCIGCIVVNPENIRDKSETTFGTFEITTLPTNALGHLSREYYFDAYLPITDEIKLELSFVDVTLFQQLKSNTANKLIFNRIKIELLNGSNVIAIYGGHGLTDQLTEINIIDELTARFSIIIKIPTDNINAIRITTGALCDLGLGVKPSNLRVYDIVSTPLDRYYASRFTGNSGQIGAALNACLDCGIFGDSLAATYTADPNTAYACYRWVAGLSLTGTEYQYIEYDWGCTPNYNLLGDQDGVADVLVFVLQEIDIADLGLSDFGINLWNTGGIELFITYTDLTNGIYNNHSSLVDYKLLGRGSGKFQVTFTIPVGKTVDKVEVRRVEPTYGSFTELRLYSIYSIVEIDPIVQFTVKPAKNQKHSTVQLEWVTIDNHQVDHFVIQRSKDGMAFENIGMEDATNHPNYYRFIDYTPLSQNNYYRLKIVDKKEKHSYSTIKNVYVDIDAMYQFIQLTNVLLIQTNHVLKEDVQISIISVDGKMLYGTTMKQGKRSTQINTNDLGMAFRVIVNTKNYNFSKFVCNNF